LIVTNPTSATAGTVTEDDNLQLRTRLLLVGLITTASFPCG
jgi:hypothetical protein